MSVDYMFPFDKIEKNENVILYGASYVALQCLEQNQILNYCNIDYIADRNFDNIDISIFKPYNIKGIIPPDDIKNHQFEHIVITADKGETVYSIQSDLEDVLGIPKEKTAVRKVKITSPGWSYSQFGEDRIIWEAFEVLGIKNPSYLDLGAHHPYFFSNTEYFYERGCRGVNVEPNPALIQEFSDRRPEDITLNVGISEEEGVADFYIFKLNSTHNTFSVDTAKSFELQFPENPVVKTVKLRTTTVSKIIEEYCNGQYPAFMDIDIEGFEWEVLNQLEFQGSKPVIIMAEVVHNQDKTLSDFNELLKRMGYTPYCRTTANIIYVDNNYYDKLFTSEYGVF
jgi:FkbM family methyltransferase